MSDTTLPLGPTIMAQYDPVSAIQPFQWVSESPMTIELPSMPLEVVVNEQRYTGRLPTLTIPIHTIGKDEINDQPDVLVSFNGTQTVINYYVCLYYELSPTGSLSIRQCGWLMQEDGTGSTPMTISSVRNQKNESINTILAFVINCHQHIKNENGLMQSDNGEAQSYIFVETGSKIQFINSWESKLMQIDASI